MSEQRVLSNYRVLDMGYTSCYNTHMKDNDVQKLREKLVIKVIMCSKDLSVEQLKKVIEYIDWFRVQNYAKEKEEA